MPRSRETPSARLTPARRTTGTSQPAGFLPLFGAAILLSFLIFGASLNHDWLSDDRPLVQDNLTLQQGNPATVIRIWTSDWWEEIGADGARFRAGDDRNLHRPLTMTTLWFNARLGATTPGPFHVTNILLHALAAALVGALAARRIAFRFAGWISMLVVALHPVGLDVINRIVGRADILVLAGLAATLLVQTKARDGWTSGRIIVLTLCAIGAMASKESGYAVLPLVVVVAWLDQERTPRPWLAPALVTGATALMLALRVSVVGLPHYVSDPRTDLLANPLAGLPFVERLPAAVANAAWYVRMLVVPWPMRAIDHPVTLSTWGDPMTWLGALALVAVLTTFGLSLRRRHESSLALGWWLLASLGVGQLLLAIGAFRETRLLYPFLGAFALGITLIAEDIARSTSRQTARLATRAAALMLPAAWLLIIVNRTAAYTDDRHLLEADLKHHPAPLTWLQLGTLYMESGRMAEARTAKENALTLAPNSTQALADVGAFHVDTDNFARGDSLLTRSLAIAPQNSVALLNLGTLRLRQNRLEESHDLLTRAEALDPDFILTQLNLTLLEMRMGRTDSVRKRLDKLRVQAPGDPRVADLMRGLGP
ncbi:MAG TPA: tetratricopeptide repeat protein [Candidatus Eisenbacteria bacterium]